MEITPMMHTLHRSRQALTAIALVLGAALLSACETTSPGATAAATAQAAPAPEPEPPMTHSRAAELCWMSTEKGAASLNLDKRADLVNKCIEEKMKGAPKS